MKYFFASVVITMFLIACQNQTKSTETADSTIVNKPLPDTIAKSVDSVKPLSLQNGTFCFAYTNNRDTISMQLVLKDSLASGNLVFNFYEKDKNKGTFTGFLKNDTLLANYTFLSEGMRSVRQVIFLLKGNILLPGSGSMKEQNNRLVFSNRKDISFDDNLVLKTVDCGTIPVK